MEDLPSYLSSTLNDKVRQGLEIEVWELPLFLLLFLVLAFIILDKGLLFITRFSFDTYASYSMIVGFFRQLVTTIHGLIFLVTSFAAGWFLRERLWSQWADLFSPMDYQLVIAGLGYLDQEPKLDNLRRNAPLVQKIAQASSIAEIRQIERDKALPANPNIQKRERLTNFLTQFVGNKNKSQHTTFFWDRIKAPKYFWLAPDFSTPVETEITGLSIIHRCVLFWEGTFHTLYAKPTLEIEEAELSKE